MELWLFVTVLLSAVALSWLLCFCFARYYIDPKHKSCLTLFMCSAALAVTVLSLTIIPLDVYAVSSALTSMGTQSDLATVKDLQSGLRVLYYVFYILVLVFAFILLPFSYFYFEEDAGEDASRASRCARASKFTLGFAVIFGVLIAVGFLVKQGSATEDTDADWRDRLVSNFSDLDQFVAFCVAILAFFGLVGFVLYVAYGMVMIPAGLWHSRAGTAAVDRRALLTQQQDLEAQVRAADEEIAYIRASDNSGGSGGAGGGRYGGQLKSAYAQESAATRGAGASTEARAATAEVRRKQHALQIEIEQTNAVIAHEDSTAGKCAGCWRASAPIRYLVALVAFGMSALLFIQVLMSTVDRIKNSECKWSCGFALPSAASPIFNPIDQLLVAVSPAFPVGLIFFGVFIVYIFACAITGLAALGVRVLCLKLFPVRAHGTPANGLIMGTWLLMFVALAVTQQVFTIAPQYVSFGHQSYPATSDTDPTVVTKKACRPDVTGLVPGTCVFTEIAKFLYRTNTQMPFFGVAQFFSTIFFLAATLAFTVYAFCRSEKSWNSYKTQTDDPDAVGYVGRGK